MARKATKLEQLVGTQGFQRWIHAARITQRLDALYYHPGFDEIADLANDRPGETRALREICQEVLYATRHDAGALPAPAPETPPPYITAASFYSGQFVEVKSAPRYSNDNRHPALSVNQEAILVCLTSDASQLAAFYSPAIHGGPIAIGSTIRALVPHPTVDAAFLAYELNQPYVVLQVLRLPSGSTIPLINLQDFLDIQVSVPPKAQQEKISSSLRVRASLLEAPTTDAAPELGGPAGATFIQVIDNIESQIAQFSAGGDGGARFLEWQGDERQPSALVRALPRSQQPLLSKKFMPTEEFLDWLIEGNEPFCIFNAIHNPRPLDFLLCRQLKLLPPLEERKLAAIFSLLAAWKTAPGPALKFQELVKTNRPIQRAFSDENEALDAIREFCRPVLALRLNRMGRRYGVFIVVGPRQWPDTIGSYETLRTQGVIWASYLRQQLQLLPELQKHGAEQTVTNLVHRLNHPLQKIDTAVELLKNWADGSGVGHQLVDEQPVNHYLQRLRDAQNELVNLSGKIRAMARAESCGNPEYLPLKELIADLTKCVKNYLHGKNCRIAYTVDQSAEGLVYADVELLCEAMLNVLENSLREMEGGDPRLEIRIQAQVPRIGFVTIEVHDNGLPQDTDLIADPFGWGTTMHFKSGRGSGYGLPFVKQVFLSVLGDCGLEKNGHGPGCRFWGTLQYKMKG